MQEQEIDLIEIVYKLWLRRWCIALFVLISLVIGGTVAFVTPRQYVAESTLGLEIENKAMRVKLEGLSAMQNMDIGDVREFRVVTPAMYPNILYSVPFQKELMHKKLILNEGHDSISFYEYYTKEINQQIEFAKTKGVQSVSEKEGECIAFLKERITLKIVDREGFLKLSVSMPEAVMAAQLAQQVQEMLQKYITEFKIAKVQAALDFIEERYVDVKREMESKQQALIDFQKEKNGRSSIQLEAKEKILNNDYELFFNLYADIVRQREQAKIQVKENMPVLTVIEPVVLPSSPVKPKRVVIMLISLFLGGFLGCSWVLISNVYKNWQLEKK